MLISGLKVLVLIEKLKALNDSLQRIKDLELITDYDTQTLMITKMYLNI